MSRLGNPYLLLLPLLAFLGVWEAGVRYFAVPVYILPTPSGIGQALWRGASSLVYVNNLWITLLETVLGFVFGTARAFVLGPLLALGRRTDDYCYPFIIMFRSL